MSDETSLPLANHHSARSGSRPKSTAPKGVSAADRADDEIGYRVQYGLNGDASPSLVSVPIGLP
jgi:hypothetical protein